MDSAEHICLAQSFSTSVIGLACPPLLSDVCSVALDRDGENGPIKPKPSWKEKLFKTSVTDSAK